MGLFDRFRRRVEEADQERGITAEEGTEQAEQAIATREQTRIEAPRTEERGAEPSQRVSEWDEIDDELEDPFSIPTT